MLSASYHAPDESADPVPRGPLSAGIIAAITDQRTDWDQLAAMARSAGGMGDILAHDDVQWSLYLLYELHYRGIAGASDSWEWHPELLRVRAELEAPFERRLRELAATVPVPVATDIAETLFAMTAPTKGPSLSRFVASKATEEQFREFLTLRWAYHLKEADPHSWAIPRLSGRAKAALVEVQADEYGGGRYERMHATLFGQTMNAVGLDNRYRPPLWRWWRWPWLVAGSSAPRPDLRRADRGDGARSGKMLWWTSSC